MASQESRGRRGFQEFLCMCIFVCFSYQTSNCIFSTRFQASLTLIFSFISNCYIYYNGLTQLRYSPYGKKVPDLCHCHVAKYKMQAVKFNFWVTACGKTAQRHKQSWLGQYQSRTQTVYVDRIGADAARMVRQVLLLKSLYLAKKDSSC